MEAGLTGGSIKNSAAVGWAMPISMASANVLIGVVTVGFIAIMYRAAMVIHTYNPHINARLYFVTHLLTILCEAVLWYFLARSAVQFKSYTVSVIESKDGLALNYIANAVALGLVYAILFGMASTVKTIFWQSPRLGQIITATNLLPIAVILIASVLLLKGSNELLHLLDKNKNVQARKWLFAYALLIFASAFAVYFFVSAAKLVDDDGLHHFSIRPGELLLVYVLPYIITWYIGLFACMNLAHFARNTKGIIYKSLFRDLYLGVTVSFIGIYLAQIFYVTNVSANNFGPGLVFVFAIIIFLIRGSLLIYSGANKLNEIENL